MIQSLGSTSNIILHTKMYLWSNFGALFQICTIVTPIDPTRGEEGKESKEW